MQVIPAVNCSDFQCARGRMKQVEEFDGCGWAHIDAADGRFTGNVTWGNPDEFRVLKTEYPQFKFEVHLMMEKPEAVLREWLSAGADRVIVHLEVLSTYDVDRERVGLTIGPETPAEVLAPHLNGFSFVQCLAVRPGMAGQRFDPRTLPKIRFLKKHYPRITIEADGGINPETARMAKEAGADIVVSASYIFNGSNPKQNYEELKKI